MTETHPNYDRIVELMALPLFTFVEATKNVKSMPCIPGFEPEAILRMEPQLSAVPVKEIRPWLEKEYLDGGRIFDGWIRVAVVQAEQERQSRNRRPIVIAVKSPTNEWQIFEEELDRYHARKEALKAIVEEVKKHPEWIEQSLTLQEHLKTLDMNENNTPNP